MRALIFLILFFSFSFTLQAQSRTADLFAANDERGEVEAVICSFNLDNFGDYKIVSFRTKMTPEEFSLKTSAILERILAAGCDIIAVQEVLGRTENAANEALDALGVLLKKATNREFIAKVGPSNDPRARVGYLVAADRARIINQVSYVKVELPKISPDQKPRHFSRGPLELQLEVFSRDARESKKVTLINFHFKSKSTRGGSDPAGLDYEPVRMEMAEGLRRIVEVRHGKSMKPGSNILILLGDRNSHYDTASARILEGTLELADFQTGGACRLSSRAVPLCKPKTATPRELFSVLTQNPITKDLRGTLRYRGVYSWIDDILLPVPSLAFAWKEPNVEGTYNSGVVYKPVDASDHALIWVGLNW